MQKLAILITLTAIGFQADEPDAVTGNGVCPACTVAQSAQNVYPLNVNENVSYTTDLEVLSGDATLGVSGGLVSNLNCGPNGDLSTCTFDANGDGSVDLVVKGDPGPADFNLDASWD